MPAAPLERAAEDPGRPLDGDLRGRLEPALGTDLGAVRVHDGEAASSAAASMGARAYTYQQDIHFGANEYAPGTAAGDHLIAHEVAHTVQQQGSSGEAQPYTELSQPGDAHEVEAELFATAFGAGEVTPVRPRPGGISRAMLQRQERDGAAADAGQDGGQARTATTGTPGVGAPVTPPPTPLPGMVGNVGYYAARHADFKARYPTPPPSPPDYYMSYGDKYARRFTTVLRPTLSPGGQLWVDRTFVLLQQAIESRLTADPMAFDALERDGASFRAFAYGTHPRAYLDGGLHTLPVTDLMRIATTPDLGDIMTLDGVSQVIETGVGLIPQWGSDAVDWGVETANDAWDWLTR
ncbi:MAG: DUF4157 domain-containing protein [Deltaproteobacteria bacterium]|nr:DUF4157 domain-containing protein [Deltaproteobacteria bacterium]